MRALSLLPILLTTALAAQNEFGIVAVTPGTGLNGTCTNFTSRGTLGVNPGSILVEVPGSHFNGVGHDASGSGTSISGVRYLMQDQNTATVEPYAFEIRSLANPGPGPDCSPTGVLFNIPGLSLPLGSGIQAFFVTNTVPTTAVPLCSTFFMGVDVPANAGWAATDGLSIHMGSYYLLQNATASNPAPNAPNIGWNCLSGTSNQTNARTYRFYLLTAAPVLNMGNEDPTLTGSGHCLSLAIAPYTNTDFGPGGLWPESQGTGQLRNDGLKSRVLHSASANGVYALFLGAASCPGIAFSSLFTGGLYLNPVSMIQVGAGALDATGTAVGPTLLVPGVAYPVNRLVHFQAFVLGPSFQLPGALSNAAGTVFLP